MVRFFVTLGFFLPLGACNDQTAAAPATTWEETTSGAPPTTEEPVAKAPRIQTLDNPGKLSDLEIAAEAPEPEPESLKPFPAAQAKAVKMHILWESGYINANRQYVIDLLERDLAYLTVKVETPDGSPVSGAQPHYSIKGSSQITAVDEAQSTDETGMVSFGVIGGKMGEDHLTIAYGGETTDVLVNIISLKAAGYDNLTEVEGAVRWDELMKARLHFKLDGVEASFPPAIAAHDRKVVKLVGFMMPLDPEEKQKHFLLTSNPPSCFFHIPGGPAGAVEVFADKGIKASWDPIILEGRFETASKSEMGVIYRLHSARALSR